MGQYDGPVYGSKKSKNRTGLFKQNKQSESVLIPRHQRAHFQPAYQDETTLAAQSLRLQKQEKYAATHQPFDHAKNKDVKAAGTPPSLSLAESYDVAFIERGYKDPPTPIDQQIQAHIAHIEDQDQVSIVEKRSEKFTYAPSLEQKKKAQEQANKTSKETLSEPSVDEKTTEVKNVTTKAYQGTKESKLVDQHMRELAQRLVKTKESFLLFEY